MKKNAFTLIELLAVIVILAIIALIATPQVIKIITQSQKSAFKESAYGIIKAGNLYYANYLSKHDGAAEEISFNLSEENENLEIKGKVSEGEMRINKEGNVAIAITDGNYCIRKDYSETDVVFDINADDCYIYEDEEVNGAIPDIKTGMIPVVIDADGTVRKSHVTSKWYSYKEKIWANAITVKEDVRDKYQSAEIGTIINEEDILTYFVWIPRYRYKLWYADSSSATITGPHSIDIIFENKDITKSDGKCEGIYEKEMNGCYLTHPAFTFENEELNGIWVGKFKTGKNGSSENNSTAPNEVVIKPNIQSWRSINVSNMFYTSLNMNSNNNIFGFMEDVDTHMMKNIEWGAVAYLSHSKYGKDSEVYVNNNKSFLTGCGGDIAEDNWDSNCKNQYGTKIDNIYNQSTSGNISGIFDMAGDVSECVMGYTTGANPKYGQSGFTDETFPNDKYIDLYDSTNHFSRGSRKLGDATGEMGPFSSFNSSWYNDYSYFFNTRESWLARGRGNSGIFSASTYAYYGNIDNYVSFRVVLIGYDDN